MEATPVASMVGIMIARCDALRSMSDSTIWTCSGSGWLLGILVEKGKEKAFRVEARNAFASDRNDWF
ncbi:hypothetical protein [Rubritalea tangerina]|uniref:hypothetical protein n=1 Tax=Rubritalea tangerina TaxID=430798 RepID=UPI003605E305